MPTNPPYAYPSNGRYFYRRRIRKSVRHHYEQEDDFIRKALNTSDRSEAAYKALQFNAEVERYWKQLENDPLAKEYEAWRQSQKPEADPDSYMAIYGLEDEMREYAEALGYEFDGKTDPLEMPDGSLNTSIFEGTERGQLLLKRLDTAQGKLSWTQAGEEWLEKSVLKDSTKKHYRRFLPIADKLLPSPGNVSPEQAHAALWQFSKDGGSSRSRAEDFVSVLRGVYNHMRGPRQSDPRFDPLIFSLKGLTFAKPIKRKPYRREELQRLFSGMGGTDRLDKLRSFSIVALYTGMRCAELCRAQIDLEAPCFIVDEELAKTEASARRVPIHPHVMPIVREWVKNGRWASSTLSTAFSDWKKAKGFGRDHTFHSFRHTVNSRLKVLGVAREDRLKVLGHEDKDDENSTYLHLELEDTAPSIALLDWSDLIQSDELDGA